MDGSTHKAAALLVKLRRDGQLIDSLEPEEQPSSLGLAYAAQRSATAMWPDRVAGWKVGVPR